MLADATLPGFVTTALGQHLQTQANPNPAAGFTGRLPSSIFANVRMLPAATTRIPCMVPQTQDLVYSKPANGGGAFAVRYFKSMRQLPRRYRQHPNAHPHALYATRSIDSA